MTTLPERLRASAQAMRGLFLVSENVPNFRGIYKDDRDRIARELEEAAVALEAWPTEGFVIVPKEPTPEMVRSGQIGVTTAREASSRRPNEAAHFLYATCHPA